MLASRAASRILQAIDNVQLSILSFSKNVLPIHDATLNDSNFRDRIRSKTTPTTFLQSHGTVQKDDENSRRYRL